MADPFLNITQFEAEFTGTLSDGEKTTATRLLQVASDRVRDLAPNARTTDAQQVVFDVVRDAVLYGHLSKFTSFHNITSRRQEMGTFNEMARAVDDLLTPQHKVILGVVKRPAYYFGD